MLQKIINTLYRYPRSTWRTYKRFGGYWAYRQMLQARDKMKAAANDLPPVLSHSDGFPVYFLTGANYLYQTLFCIQSLARVTQEKFHFILVDDGSFTTSHLQQIARQLPGAECISHDQINDYLQSSLPAEEYPALNQKRKVYPHIKKLTDIYALPGNDWKLVLDSDMLFWQNPTEIIEWLKNPAQPLHMLDCVESYGYSHKLMSALCGSEVPDLLNVGAIGLNNRVINWTDIESWIQEMEAKEGFSYYLEQALTAMIVGNKPATVLGRERYCVNPDTLNDNKAALHHYVDLSKKIYFNQAWQKLLT